VAAVSALEGLRYGLSIATAAPNLLAALVGAAVGTAIGVLPGLGPAAAMALVLPLTYGLPPATGLIALAGIYYGAMYGGSTTSILLNVPGEAASVVTTIDGHRMARRGRAGAALAVVAAGSFVAGTLSVGGLALFAPSLASAALAMGPPQLFALTAVALVVLARLSGGSLPRAAFVAALGLLLSTIGVEPVTGVRRFDFGRLEFALGINIVAAVMGLFGAAEMLVLARDLAAVPPVRRVRLRELWPTAEEWRRAVPAWLRGTGAGFIVGLLPGPGSTLSTFVAYRVEQAVGAHRGELGQGAVEGIAAPEAANNAAATAAFVPLLSLGLPFSGVMALLQAGMMIHGVQPGPLLVDRHPDLFWGVIASMYVGNVALLVLNLPLVGVWVSLLRAPLPLMLAAILLLAVTGSYAFRNSLFDVWVMAGLGILGYALRTLGFPLVPLVLALVLGPFIEKYLLESLFLGRGDLLVFVGDPVTLAIWGVGALLIALGALRRPAPEG
jgi:putative tricarboxylic transport membrane protein